jgi:hypothetical protein
MKKTKKVNTSSMTHKNHILISPNGKRYVVDNLSKFSRRFGLDRSAISRVSAGLRKMHKNWTSK